jgi:phosphate transport system substrate-binding protein
MGMLKTIVAFAAGASLALSAAGASLAADLSGAGATFPAPVYAKWAETYKAEAATAVNYQAIGSGGGIKQIKAKTVEFGATDKPLKIDELNAAGLFQFPTVMGGVVPVVNLPGVAPGAIRLTGDLLGEIYLGDIKKWNDPKIAAVNKGVKLPALPITVVHRSDGSGTSFVYTNYLSLKNATWKSKVGANDAVEWPTGIGGKGNDGVAAVVKQTIGSIGYVEYAYAKQNKMTYTKLQTAGGAFVDPTAQNFAAAASHAQWSAGQGFYLLLLDQPGANSWPITAATFILIYKQQANPAVGNSILKFFDWAYKKGDAQAVQLDYVPLPANVKALVRKAWLDVKGPDGKPVYSSR